MTDERTAGAIRVAQNYQRAIRYLDGCGEFTLDKLRECYRIADLADSDMHAETRRLWDDSKNILSRPGEPGGTEYVRFNMRNQLLEGLQKFPAQITSAYEKVHSWIRKHREAGSTPPFDQGGYSDQYRLLSMRTPFDGVVFWISETSRANDSDYWVSLMVNEAANLPPEFMQRYLNGSKRFNVGTFPCAKGGCELHLDLLD